jgi:hypothetical protein
MLVCLLWQQVLYLRYLSAHLTAPTAPIQNGVMW